MIRCGVAVLVAAFGAVNPSRAEVFTNLLVTGYTTMSNTLTVVGNATVSGYVDANSYGYQAAGGAVDSGASFAAASYALYAATNCGGFGRKVCILSDSQYRYAYGDSVTNDVGNYSHVFGHAGAKYCAFTKDAANFYVPVTVPVSGDIPMGSYTNSP
jgi:hypothetical protein